VVLELALAVILLVGAGLLVRMVLGQALRMVMVGVAMGVVGSLGLTRFLTSILCETSPTDPMIFTTVILVFTAVSLAACYPPTRRAAEADPEEALRAE
jgi:ABC-type lipoprotein release transport system permease subunit